MKTKWMLSGLLAIGLCAETCQGVIVATVRSPKAEFPAFRVVLDATGQPAAVANFLGLADGSQSWADPETGHVRGGAGDAFYKDFVFDWQGNGVVRGGSHGMVAQDGSVQYTGGPGYTVTGKTDEGWTPHGWGALALVEEDGPHSGGSEIALHLTNGVTAWTVFGQVAAGDEAGARELAARVAEGVTDAEWSIDASGATKEETTALATARAALPRTRGIESRLPEGATGIAFDWPPNTRLVISGGGDLMTGLGWLGAGWHEQETVLSVDFAWEDLGLGGTKGFVALSGVEYPKWTGRPFTGKWRMVMEHTGKRLQYWFDFDGKTGMVAVVESGEITTRSSFSQVETWRETGNSIGIYYGQGLMGNFYYLGFAEAGAMAGRFMSKQMTIIGETGRDWGTFELAEGWEEEKTTNTGSATGKATFTRRWLPWKAGHGPCSTNAIRLPHAPRQPGTVPRSTTTRLP